jgi:hypothetical protein
MTISNEMGAMGRIHQICEILTLAECYARARQIAPSTLSHRARGSSTWLERCATGNVTIRSAIGFVQWLSDNWPFGLEWPAGMGRPEPEPGSPARAFFAPSSRVNGSATSFEAAPRRLQVVAKGCEAQATHPFGDESLAAAMRLGPSGRLASPGALCGALGLKRSVYYAAVRRYRDEVGAGRWPRSGTDSERVLIALSTSGDVRFASRRTRPAA